VRSHTRGSRQVARYLPAPGRMMNDCNTLQPQQGYFCDSSRHRTSKGQQDPGWPPLGQQMSCQRSIHLQQLTGAFTLPVSSSRRLYSNSISSNRTWQLQQQQRNMAAAQSVAADGQHSVDWQAYNARWQDIWQGGLQKGQVRPAVKQLVLTAYVLCDVVSCAVCQSCPPWPACRHWFMIGRIA
jgi:hypothetical protein